jgi:hypothetical protein
MTSYLDPISLEDVPIIEKVCKECGEESIFIDRLLAYWSVEEQQWKLGADVDELIARKEAEIWCSNCTEETEIVDVVLNGENKIFRG